MECKVDTRHLPAFGALGMNIDRAGGALTGLSSRRCREARRKGPACDGLMSGRGGPGGGSTMEPAGGQATEGTFTSKLSHSSPSPYTSPCRPLLHSSPCISTTTPPPEPSTHRQRRPHVAPGSWGRAPTLLLLPLCMGLLLGVAGGAQQPQENASHPYGEIGYGYWAQGVTSYPCTSPEDCALMFNGSDPLRDAILLEEEEEEASTEPCVVTGHLYKSVNWFGYLATFNLRSTGGRIYYRFIYPEDRCCVRIIFYLEEQVLGLRARMNCLQKQAMVDPSSRQVILLSPTDPSSGCSSNKTDNNIRVIECTSGRVLKSNEDRTWYLAASSCGSPTGLDLKYSFVAYGHKGKCPEPVPDQHSGAASLAQRGFFFVRASNPYYNYFTSGNSCRLWLLFYVSVLITCCHLVWDAVR